MFEAHKPQTMFGSFINIMELTYHSTVREIRKTHRNALVGLMLNMLQAVIFVAAFYVMLTVLGMRRAAIRGDFMLYIMSGIFIFLTHTKALGAVFGSEGSTSVMLKHAPLNSAILIMAAALGALYTQVLSMFTILYVYHVVANPVEIFDPIGAMAMLLLAWFSGVALGMIFLSIKPWAPNFANVAQQVWQRANMIASGKMFVANATPTYILSLFEWNPLFHIIDQARGFIFINYFPYKTSLMYPVYFSLGVLMIGMMAEFFTRKHASESWAAAR